MNPFAEALISQGRAAALPEADNYFQKLIGSWSLDYIDHRTSCTIKGEWHFSWVLEGMAIQDVIILPSRETRTQVPHPLTEYGTSLRVYNPDTHAWDVVYGYTGNIIRLEARKQDDRVVLTNLEDPTRKWVFLRIEDQQFHWQNITVNQDGTWHVHADIYAQRI